MLNGVIISDKIDSIIEPQPKVLVLVQEKVQDIVVLQPFFPGKILNDLPLFIDDISAIQVGSDGQPVLTDRDGGQHPLIDKRIGPGKMKGGDLLTREKVKASVNGTHKAAVLTKRKQTGDLVTHRKAALIYKRRPQSVAKFQQPVLFVLGDQLVIAFPQK